MIALLFSGLGSGSVKRSLICLWPAARVMRNLLNNNDLRLVGRAFGHRGSGLLLQLARRL